MIKQWISHTTLFPNPATDKVQWTTENNWMLLNNQGIMLATGNGNKVDLQNYASGYYLLKIGENVHSFIKK